MAPIARVISPQGYYFIYLSTAPAPPTRHQPSRAKSKLHPATIEQITLALQHGLTIEELYATMTSNPNSLKEFTVGPDEYIEILPSPNPTRYYIAGPSGAGKTYVAASLARGYKQLHPKRAIILFARSSDDPAFEGIAREEIVLDKLEQEAKGRTLDDLAEEIKEIPISDYSNKLVILDDTDNLTNKPLLKTMVALNGDLMCNGRKLGISTIYISHIMLNAHQSKIPLNESQYVFFFPGSGTRGIRSFLKDYAGMENTEIKKIMSITNSRWIMLSRNAPRYIATEKSIFLL
jgi:hypothetical protein